MENRELRIALVMTGGVSLAVWMGGVSGEVFRAIRKEGLYGDLCKLTETDVVVDVIAGASAGGLNGALLGTAIARDLKSEKFDELRNLWLRVAGFDDLLRSPFKTNPPSLLKGDDFFLVQLRDVLRNWVSTDMPGTSQLEDDALTVILTASLLTPELSRFTDDFGTPIIEPVHRGRFTFTGCIFNETEHLADRLALAARTSASFPGAFEASYIPVGTTMPGRPDMGPVASFKRSHWAVDGGVLMNKPVGPALDAIARRPSNGEVRRVVAYVNPDPGEPSVGPDLYDETPTMAQVILSSLVTLPRSESIANDLRELLAHNQKVSGHRNLRDALLRGIDVAPANGGPPPTDDGPPPSGGRRIVPLEVTAELLYPYWVKRSAIAAVDREVEAFYVERGVDPTHLARESQVEFADLHTALEQARADVGWLPSNLPSVGGPIAGIDGARVIDLAEEEAPWRWGTEPLEYLAQLILDLIHRTYGLLPLGEDDRVQGLRTALGDVRGAVHRENAWLRVLRQSEEDYWQANLAHLGERDTHCATTLAFALHAEWPRPPADLRSSNTGGSQEPRAHTVERLRLWAQLQALEDRGDVRGDKVLAPTEAVPRGSSASVAAAREVDALTTVLAQAAEAPPETLRAALNAAQMRIGRRLTGQLLALRATIDDALTLVGPVPPAPPKPQPCPPLRVEPPADVLRSLSDALFRDIIPTHESPFLLRRILCLYVVHSATDEMPSAAVRTEFIQVSAFGENQLDPSRTLPQQKVAGLQLGHFGSFLKASWRANDWMWGALDGSARLVHLLLEPARLRQRFPNSDSAVGELGRILTGTSECLRDALTDGDRTYLASQWPEVKAKISKELEFLDGPRGVPVPRNLPQSVAAVTRVLQMTIAARELPVVGASVIASEQRGGDFPYQAIVFTELLKRYGDGAGNRGLPLERTAELLENCKVGLETVNEELGSDLGASTAARAAAVGTTAISGTRSGLGPLRAPVASVRVAVLAAYLMVNSATRKTKVGFAFATFLLAVAGSVIAARLLGADIANSLIVVACVLLAVWLFYTSVSARSWWFLVIGLVVLAVIALSFIDENKVCSVFATTCPGDVEQPGWKGPVRVLVPAVLALMTVSFLITWRKEEREEQIEALEELWAGASSTVKKTKPGRLLMWAGALALLGLAYPLVLHDVLFTGDGTGGPRRWFVDRVETISHNRALVTLVLLPGVVILFNYLGSLVRGRRTQLARLKALRELNAASKAQ